MPDPISSPAVGRPRRPGFDSEPPAVQRPRRVRRLLAALPVVAGFAVFGTVVLLAYEDASRGPPIGEPPLIKAAADPIKLPPEEAAESTLEEEGTVGRLWSDAEQADQPERLLPPPEAPLSPPAVEESTAESALAQPADPAEPGSAKAAGDVTTAALPSDTAAREVPKDASLEEAEAALDRLLAEVTALSEEDAAASDATTAPPTGRAPTGDAEVQSASPTIDAAETPAAQTRGRAAPAAPVSSSLGTATPTPAAGAPATTARTSAEVRRAGAIATEQSAVPQASAEEPAETAAVTGGSTPISPPAVTADGDFRIQLAAVREEADARRAWDLFMIDLGPVLSQLEPIFERAETANGVFYRVQIGPFASQQAAENLCEDLKQRNASCFVIRR